MKNKEQFFYATQATSEKQIRQLKNSTVKLKIKINSLTDLEFQDLCVSALDLCEHQLYIDYLRVYKELDLEEFTEKVGKAKQAYLECYYKTLTETLVQHYSENVIVWFYLNMQEGKNV